MFSISGNMIFFLYFQLKRVLCWLLPWDPGLLLPPTQYPLYLFHNAIAVLLALVVIRIGFVWVG